MRYFFDVSSDSMETRDEEGCEISSEARMQGEARRILAEIAEEEARLDSRAVFTAQVRDVEGRAVYRAVLTLEGTKLQ